MQASSALPARMLVDEFRSRPTMRAGSLITTVFGDSIAPRGGTVWLGSLIEAMADFGISERLVRTSVFRLVKDGWLQSTSRRAALLLQPDRRGPRAISRRGQHRIYGEPSIDWDGRVVPAAACRGSTRTRMPSARNAAGWASAPIVGERAGASGAGSRRSRHHAERLGVEDEVVVMSGADRRVVRRRCAAGPQRLEPGRHRQTLRATSSQFRPFTCRR